MTQAERRDFLINYLLNERRGYEDVEIPEDEEGKRRLLRTLFNVRPALLPAQTFLDVQDTYLQTELTEKGITDANDLKPIDRKICLWQGDITRLRCDAVVNDANSGLTGCYRALHDCTDSRIHTFAGVQLRYECAKFMEAQGFEEPPGRAVRTQAYNLPCRHVIHTVAPAVHWDLKPEHEEQLKSCCMSCLTSAEEAGDRIVAFPRLAAGEPGYPPKLAAAAAVGAVHEYLMSGSSIQKVVFVAKDAEEFMLYAALLA